MKWFLRGVAVVLLLVVAAALVFYLHPLWVSDQQIRFTLWRDHAQSKYVEAGGYRLHYYEVLPQDGSAGTPLLMIHGLGARSEDWGVLMTQLAAKGFHVYAPDLLGYGRSPKPDVSYSISLEEAAVVAFMQAVHLTRPEVAGWSMGGWVAMKLTLDHPELVDRLVVYDSAGVYFNSAETADIFTPSDVAGVRRLMAVLSPKPLSLPDFIARDVARKLQKNAWIIRRSVGSMMAGRDLLDFKLQGVSRPTLVVWGSRDELIPVEAGDRIHAGIADSSMVVVEGCGHLAPAQCWRPVLASTVEFLRAEPVIRGGKKTVAHPED
jgi:pimeloyl-ACP methyl ester carboxylesterase